MAKLPRIWTWWPGQHVNGAVVNAKTGICWRKYWIDTPDKIPQQKRRKNKGDSELPPIVALTPKATKRQRWWWAKTKLLGWCPKQILHKKNTFFSKDECAPVQVCEGLLPRMNERNKVERKNCGSQSGRGASKATISQGRIEKGFARYPEQVPIHQTTLRKMVMDGSSRDPWRSEQWRLGNSSEGGMALAHQVMVLKLKKEVGETCSASAKLWAEWGLAEYCMLNARCWSRTLSGAKSWLRVEGLLGLRRCNMNHGTDQNSSKNT